MTPSACAVGAAARVAEELVFPNPGDGADEVSVGVRDSVSGLGLELGVHRNLAVLEERFGGGRMARRW